MKRKKSQSDVKPEETAPATTPPPAQPVPTPERIISTGEAMEMAERVAPPPEDVEHMADEEPNRRFLRDYIGAIRKLRDKGFSFREIAEWLSKLGIPADHNSVYRVYLRSMTPLDAEAEAHREQEDAEDGVNQD